MLLYSRIVCTIAIFTGPCVPSRTGMFTIHNQRTFAVDFRMNFRKSRRTFTPSHIDIWNAGRPAKKVTAEVLLSLSYRDQRWNRLEPFRTVQNFSELSQFTNALLSMVAAGPLENLVRNPTKHCRLARSLVRIASRSNRLLFALSPCTSIHSLDAADRVNSVNSVLNIKSKPVRYLLV